MVIYNVAKRYSCPKSKDPFGQWNTVHQDPWLVPGHCTRAIVTIFLNRFCFKSGAAKSPPQPFFAGVTLLPPLRGIS